MYDVTGIGGAAWDFLSIIEKPPGSGEKIKMSQVMEQGGGQTGTAIVTVARLGGKAAIAGVTGDDEAGYKIRNSFIKEGVDTTCLIMDPGKTSHIAFCFSLENSGERTIFYNRGTKRFLKPSDLNEELIKECKCLLVDTHHGEATLAGAEIARKAGIPVVTDIERDKPVNEELFRIGTHHIIPGNYLLSYTGEDNIEKAIKTWEKRFPNKILVATLGEKGSIASFNNEIIRQSPYKIEKVIDTTGAGDVFHGAFALGLTLGYDLRKNLAFASLVAGLKCRSAGGRAGIPRKEELKKHWPDF